MISGRDRISDFPEHFNRLERDVKNLSRSASGIKSATWITAVSTALLTLVAVSEAGEISKAVIVLSDIFKEQYFVSNLPNWISAIFTVAVSAVAIYEFYLRRVPILRLKIDYRESATKGIIFFARPINFGHNIAHFRCRATDIIIQVGDEIYSAQNDVSGYSYPGDTSGGMIDIGSINAVGIERLTKGEYLNNTASLSIKLSYSPDRWKWRTRHLCNKYQLHFFVNEGKVDIAVGIVEEKFR